MMILPPSDPRYWTPAPRTAFLQTHVIAPGDAAANGASSLPTESLARFGNVERKRQVVDAQSVQPLDELLFSRPRRFAGTLSLTTLIDHLPFPGGVRPLSPWTRPPLIITSSPPSFIFLHALGCLETRVHAQIAGLGPALLPAGFDTSFDALSFANAQLNYGRSLLFGRQAKLTVTPGFEPERYAQSALLLMAGAMEEGKSSLAWIAIAARALAMLGEGDDARAASRLLLLLTAWPALCPSVAGNTPAEVMTPPHSRREADVRRMHQQWQRDALALAVDAAGLSAAAGHPEATGAFADAMGYGFRYRLHDTECLGIDRWRQALSTLPPSARRTEVLLALGPSNAGGIVGRRAYADEEVAALKALVS